MEKIDTDCNNEFEKLRLNFSICANRDCAPLIHDCVSKQITRFIFPRAPSSSACISPSVNLKVPRYHVLVTSVLDITVTLR